MTKVNILSTCDNRTAREINEFDFVNKHFFIRNFREKNPLNLIGTENFTILNYHKFKFGTFSNFINWDNIPPLDGYLLEKMAKYEGYILKMYERVQKIDATLYNSRKHQYYLHLRFWNYFLDKNKIDVFYSYAPPHIGFDYIIYCLCKLKNIKTFSLIRIFKFAYIIDDVINLFDNDNLFGLFDDNTNNVELDKLKELKEIHNQRKIPQNNKDKTLVIPNKKMQLKLSNKFIRIKSYYEKLITIPNLNIKYIYVPLHYQPEGTTCPMGGYFVDQQLMLEILNKLNIKIYVKEHPRTSKNRSIAYYKNIANLKNVEFVSVKFSTYDLIDNAFTVATVTGMAGFESILRKKTSIIFGNTFYKYSPGCFTAKNLEEVKESIEQINKFKYDDNFLKSFLYNFEKFLFDMEGFEKSYKNIAEELSNRIKKYFL